MPTKPYSDDEYRKDFLSIKVLNKRALDRALEIRKFEIDLYWKRASYFWTFIGATLAGFVAVQVSTTLRKDDMSVLLASLGLVFSVAWLFVNRGSKYWQENWEYHVDMLEDSVNGPLYKVVLERSVPKNLNDRAVHLLTGPSPVSVSKINQLISLFVTVIWIILLCYSLPPFRVGAPINWFYVFVISTALLACSGFYLLCGTYVGGSSHRATKRTAKIKNDA